MVNEAESSCGLSFEGELENLERVVNLLERGELTLEEAIRQYESGFQSLKRCQEILDRARKRIEILTGSIDSRDSQSQGSPFTWKPLESSDLPPDASTSSKQEEASG